MKSILNVRFRKTSMIVVAAALQLIGAKGHGKEQPLAAPDLKKVYEAYSNADPEGAICWVSAKGNEGRVTSFLCNNWLDIHKEISRGTGSKIETFLNVIECKNTDGRDYIKKQIKDYLKRVEEYIGSSVEELRGLFRLLSNDPLVEEKCKAVKAAEASNQAVESGHKITGVIGYGDSEVVNLKDVPFFAVAGDRLIVTSANTTYDESVGTYSLTFTPPSDWAVSSSNLKAGPIKNYKLNCEAPKKESEQTQALGKTCTFSKGDVPCILTESEPSSITDRDGYVVSYVYKRTLNCKNMISDKLTRFSRVLFLGDLDSDGALDVIGESSDHCGESYYWDEIEFKNDRIEVKHHANGASGGCL